MFLVGSKSKTRQNEAISHPRTSKFLAIFDKKSTKVRLSANKKLLGGRVTMRVGALKSPDLGEYPRYL